MLAICVCLHTALVTPAVAAPQGALADSGGGAAVVVPRIGRAPSIEMLDVGGAADVAAAAGMVRVEGLVTRLPRDGEPMSERTAVYLGYDDRTLYAVFICHDSDDNGVRAHLNVRDKIRDGDDSIALQIDTFRDRKHAYGFQVNPVGVQQDGLWTEGKGWDLSFDTVWYSDARMSADGYVVLISVPFKSLRFSRAPTQAWGVLLFREIARKNEQGFWPAYSTKIAGRMNQAGLMHGLGDVSPGRNLQLLPYAGGRAFRALDVTPQRARFVSDGADTDLGADARVVLKDSIAVDATANPDFSQVESDEPQVTVNKRFETFFPEKRPFFLENASYFGTPIPLLFTRRILHPDMGARVTGRLGRYALGGLLVRDRPGLTTAAVVGVLRVTRDIGSESSVGAFLSERRSGPSLNRVAGIDGRVKLSSAWVATLQAVTSTDRDRAGNEKAGNASNASLQRVGRSFGYTADFNDRSPSFHSAVGFIERTGVRALDQTATYRVRPTSGWLLSWGPDIVVNEVRDRGNRRLDRLVTPKAAFEWPGLTTLVLYAQSGRVRLRPEELPLLEREGDFEQDRKGFEFTTGFARGLTLSLKGATGRTANLAPPSGGRPELASLTELNLTADVRPTERLSINASYLLTRLRDRATHGAIFTDRIARAKLGFQFTRSLSARAIVQYNSLTANPGATSLEARRSINLDLMLAWLRTPGTALYVGYNDNLENIHPSLIVETTGLRRVPRGLISSGRQFFVKFSYLVRI